MTIIGRTLLIFLLSFVFICNDIDNVKNLLITGKCQVTIGSVLAMVLIVWTILQSFFDIIFTLFFSTDWEYYGFKQRNVDSDDWHTPWIILWLHPLHYVFELIQEIFIKLNKYIKIKL